METSETRNSHRSRIGIRNIRINLSPQLWGNREEGEGLTVVGFGTFIGPGRLLTLPVSNPEINLF